MKTFVSAIVLFCFASFTSIAQDVTGIWKGYFVTDGGEGYRVEFQVLQQKTGLVTGVSYSYGDNVSFYGKATMTGRFIKADRNFKIQETRTTEVRMSFGSGTVLMNYDLAYSKSGKEEFLEGRYIGRTEDREEPKNNGPWGSGGGGRVFLRRVLESDFYTEPFLRDKIKNKPAVALAKPPSTKPPAKPVTVPPAKPPVIKPAVTKKPAVKPPANKPAIAKPAIKPPVNKPAVVKTAPVTSPKRDTPVRKPVEAIVIEKPVPPKTVVPPPATTRSRQNQLTQTFTVSHNDINIKLYDNGEIDDDTISVYLDGQPLALNKRLSAVPISLSIKVDAANPEHTLVMVAENMGRIPPNTSLMVVEDGDKRYKAGITSTEQKNAMVRFRYEKKE